MKHQLFSNYRLVSMIPLQIVFIYCFRKANTLAEWNSLLIPIEKLFDEAATESVLSEKVFLNISQNSQENTCARVSFLIKLQDSACSFIKRETLVQMFSCEFCEISKNTFSYRTPLDDCFCLMKCYSVILILLWWNLSTTFFFINNQKFKQSPQKSLIC